MSSIFGGAWAAFKENRRSKRAIAEEERKLEYEIIRHICGSTRPKSIRNGLEIAFWNKALDLQGFDKESDVFYLYLYDREDAVLKYVVSVTPDDSVSGSDIYVGLHWMYDDGTYGGWVCDKKPIYNGFRSFDAEFSLKEVAKLELPRTRGIKLFPVVYYSSDGVFDHASFKTTMEDATSHELLLQPDSGIIGVLRREWAEAKANGKEAEYDSPKKEEQEVAVMPANQSNNDSDMGEYVFVGAIVVGVAAYFYLGVFGVVLWALLLISAGIGGGIAKLKRSEAFWIGFWMSLFVPVIGWVIACLLPQGEQHSDPK